MSEKEIKRVEANTTIKTALKNLAHELAMEMDSIRNVPRPEGEEPMAEIRFKHEENGKEYGMIVQFVDLD